MNGIPIIVDRALLRRRRARAAASIARHDAILAHAADELAGRLELVTRPFPVALDLGAHHGLLAPRLARLPDIGTVISSDCAPELLAHCPEPRLCADEEALPFGPATLDLVVSALSLHLVNDLPGCLAQIGRALRPDGYFSAVLFGSETLKELRQALSFAEAELEGGASPRVMPFGDVRSLGALLQRGGFALPVADCESVTVTYPTALHLMRELRGAGQANALSARSRKPMRRATLMRAVEYYQDSFATAEGRVRATFELVFLSGWAPHDSQQQPLKPGSARVRLADALGAEERSAGEKAPGPKRR